MSDFDPPSPPPPPAVSPLSAPSQPPAWWKRRWWKLPVWAWLTILAVIIAAGAAGGGGKKEDDAAGIEPTSAVSEPARTDEETTADETTEPAATSPATTEPATTDAPTTTAQPTTSTSSTTTTTLPPAPLVFTGAGDDVVDIGAGNTALFVIASHDGQSNFIVHSLDEDLQDVDGVVNEIGTFAGTVPLSTFGSVADVRYLEVQADGNWSLELIGIARLPVVNDPSFAGAGKQVVLYMGGGGIFTITHDGTSNFIVHVTTADGVDGLINEIGPYSGRKPVPAGAAIIEVNADGNWSFTGS
jgi:hypothetical protein